ncbi:ferritin-like domain-containing protein [Desulfosoma caldarium]|uniref:Rubrerythrin n=1 Tax=Desulfosoma caldarium TaxID=610254 RepID=A0A3N1VSS3_9BACT|nr:ferritin family protein [Desulfosoma caldarium]ROR03272.1 rubrerythrin [Desulfosoma caldarium]
MIFGFNAAEVFQIAVEIEENGKAFYEKVAAKIDDPDVQAIFRDLAQQEVEHQRKFQELKAQLPPQAAQSTVYDPNNEMAHYLKMMADGHVFRTSESVDAKIATIQDAVDALRMAMEFEKDSVIFFLSMQDATEEEKGRQFIGLLVKEEQEHLRRLAVQLKKMTH